MSNFSPTQIRALSGKLDRRHVHCRNVEGKDLAYIQGWFAIDQANAIFGFSGWDRELVHFEKVYERSRGELTSCAYFARVRIRVHAGAKTVLREGTGWGSASGQNLADIYERAIKSAETDATKRALATFGNRFGLCLYDKEQGGVQEPTDNFFIYTPNGSVFADELSPQAFCSGARQLISKLETPAELSLWFAKNLGQIKMLREVIPALKNAKGEHYADILERLVIERLSACAVPIEEPSLPQPVIDERPSKIAPGPKVDKASLTIASPRRFRDKAHLQAIAANPCLICGRNPSHAHHLKFAQSHGLSQKVSDEFVVPLCAIHHGELHRATVELEWWRHNGVDPLPIALELWKITRQGRSKEAEAVLPTPRNTDLPSTDQSGLSPDSPR
jgi:DNA recombination protein Rad52